jgi:peptidoglycan/LPS O-acetylase OafA/YrhL
MLLLGLSEDNWFSRMLSVAPLVLLGEASYSFYLLHFFFNDWIRGHGVGSGLSACLLKLALLLPLSLGMYFLGERPIRKFLLSYWNRRHQPAQEPAKAFSL